MKTPHCKICGHNHSGPCTECPDCNKSTTKKYGEKWNEPPVDVQDDPFDASEARQKIAQVILRIESIEKRLDAIDSRRKYQREYMRKKRSGK